MSKFTAFPDKLVPDQWRVESEPDSDGAMEVIIFCEANAEREAQVYAQWRETRAKN
jgi:hypothetical protein